MKNIFVRYAIYLVTVGVAYSIFRVSDFNPTQSKTLALVVVALAASILELRQSDKHK